MLPLTVPTNEVDNRAKANRIRGIICDICGDVGFPEYMRICSRCKTSSEHSYCMQFRFVGKEWQCNLCQDNQVRLNSPWKSTGSFRRLDFSGKNQRGSCKFPRKGKVKFLSFEEAVCMPLISPALNPMKNPCRGVSDIPMMNTCWKGKFYVSDALSLEIQAHYPLQRSPKLRDISVKMPKLLKFKTLPCAQAWPRIFQLQSPDVNDVGMFFLPCQFKRSKEYFDLLEHLDLYGSVLVTRFTTVQMIVFTSKVLPTESKYMDGKSYMWGVFQPIRVRKKEKPLNEPAIIVDCRQEVEMAIDMVGGIEVDVIDNITHDPKVPPGFERLQVKFSLKNTSEPAASVPKRGFDLLEECSNARDPDLRFAGDKATTIRRQVSVHNALDRRSSSRRSHVHSRRQSSPVRPQQHGNHRNNRERHYWHRSKNTNYAGRMESSKMRVPQTLPPPPTPEQCSNPLDPMRNESSAPWDPWDR